MPTTRHKRAIHRKSRAQESGLALEYLISGQWWDFLAPPEWVRPDEEQLRRIWFQNRDMILAENQEAWGRRIFEGWSPPGEDTEKWIGSPGDQAARERGCWFDLSAARRVDRFFSRFLRHSKGEWAGKPFDLLEWQRRDVIYPLFGWRKPDGTRRFRMAYIEVPKKNGKSALCSGLALYLLVGDDEQGAEVYSAAADRDQATIVFNESAHMVELSPALRALCRVYHSVKRIEYKNSIYRSLSADVPTKEGLNISALIFDELHAQRTRDLWDALRYGGAARRQPLLISITTAGFDRNSICWEQHDYAQKVLEGVIEDDTFFAYIRSAGEEDDWTDPAIWRKANPSLGVTISEDSFASDCREAQESPVKENSFKRYRLNLWTEQETRWLAIEKWDACAIDGGIFGEIPRKFMEPQKLLGKPCYAGLDLASTIDICALILNFVMDERYFWLGYFWVPAESAAQREHRDRVPYRRWAQDGWIEMTPGDVADYDLIRRRIQELGERFKICEIAIDRWNSTQLQVQLQDDGFEVIPMGQGMASMSAPTKAFEARVLQKKIIHGGNPVLRWMARNLVVRTDAAGNLKPDKSRSSEKIDGIVAGIMALDCAERHGNRKKKSIYDDRGLIFI